MQRWKKICAVLEVSTFRGTFLNQLRGPKSSTTKLPVELLKDVEGLGQSGSIVQVNHGYARNYLVPNKIATIKRGKQSGSIAPGFGAVFQAQHESVVSALSKQHQQGQQGTLSSEEEDAKQAENIQKAIKKLTSSTLMIKRKASDTGLLDKPVYAQDVAEAVSKQFQIELVEKMVGMGSECLERVGDYELPLNFYLPGNERATLDVRVEST